MGSSNIALLREVTIFKLVGKLLGMTGDGLAIVVAGVVAVIFFFLLNWFLRTEIGLALRASGDKKTSFSDALCQTDWEHYPEPWLDKIKALLMWAWGSV
jgi:putative ABC transport system permease protein